MPCPHCNAAAGPTDLYCSSCGARLTPSSTSSVPVAAEPPAQLPAAGFSSTPVPPSSSRSWALVALINIGLLSASAFLVYRLLLRYGAPSGGVVQLGEPRQIRPSVPKPGPDGPSALTTGTDGGARPRDKGHRLRPRAVLTTARTSEAGGPPGPVVDGAAAVPVAEPNRPADASPVRAGDTGTSSVAAPPLEPEEQQRATLDAESVRMVVRHHLPQVRACYDRALKQQEGIAGVVEVEFEVTAEGTVASSNVHRNTTGHEGLGLCIAGLLRAWRFPRPVGGQVVFVYPFVFSARE